MTLTGRADGCVPTLSSVVLGLEGTLDGDEAQVTRAAVGMDDGTIRVGGAFGQAIVEHLHSPTSPLVTLDEHVGIAAVAAGAFVRSGARRRLVGRCLRRRF